MWAGDFTVDGQASERRVQLVTRQPDDAERRAESWRQVKMSGIERREIKHLLLRHTEEWLESIEILAPAVLDSSEVGELNSEIEKLRAGTRCFAQDSLTPTRVRLPAIMGRLGPSREAWLAPRF
jgi:hypothetical protein